MKRLLLLLSLAASFAHAQSAQGPYGVFGGPIPSASLPAAALVPANTVAFTTDQGLMIDNGSAWVVLGSSGGVSIANGTVCGNTSGVTGACTSTYPSGQITIQNGFISTTQLINVQTGTTYALATTDAGKLILRSNASSCADTLSVATTTGFGTGYSFDYQNNGSVPCTITPTTSLINGGASITVGVNLGCTVTSDGTNYQTSACTALGSSTPSIAINNQTGTTYTIQASDNGKLVTFNNASTTAISLPVASTFSAGFYFYIQGISGSASATLTPTTSTIAGGSFVGITAGGGCLVIDDGTNYQVESCPYTVTSVGGATNYSIAPTAGTVFINNSNATRITSLCTGTTSGACNIGGGSSPVVINSSATGTTSIASHLLTSAVSPTISSGFGTTPSISHANGTLSFSVNVGTGGTATSGVVGLPTATDAWSCWAADTGTTPTGQTEQTGTSTTTATFTNYSRTTGLAVAWTASEILQIGCAAN
jgi:hypothetical protein